MIIDSHCHLPHNIEKAQKWLDNAKLEEVEKVITIGTSIKNNKKAIEMAEKFETVYATAGIYPHEDTDKSLEELKESLQEFAASPNKIVGIGECGIDITEWKGGRTVEDQIQLFEMQIETALENNLPIIIHNRNGDEQILKSLQKYKNDKLRGVAHCFATSWETAQKLLDIGFYISFSALITYPSRTALLETVEKVPLDRFLVETDAPYLPPQGYRGQENEPKYVKMVVQKIALIKNKPEDIISNFSYNNTCTLFNI